MATSIEIETWPPAREQFHKPYAVSGEMIGEPAIRSAEAVMRTGDCTCGQVGSALMRAAAGSDRGAGGHLVGSSVGRLEVSVGGVPPIADAPGTARFAPDHLQSGRSAPGQILTFG